MLHTDKSEDINKTIALHLQLALEVGNVAWWEMELPSGNIIFNENKTKMLGYEAKNFNHYTDFTKLVHPDDYEPMMKAMRDHMSGLKDVYETEYRIKCSTGEYKNFYDRGRIIEKDEKGFYRIVGVVQNITELKKTVMDLQKKIDELAELNKFMIGRELKMTELKKELDELKKRTQ